MAADREPDNAALLYYQAFLLCPDVYRGDNIPQEVRWVLNSPSGGNVAELRKYTKDYQYVIQLLEAAYRLPNCNLAVPRSPQGISGKIRLKLAEQTNSAALLIGANVRVLAADGDYRKALSQCLMLRRLAWHIGNDPPHAFDPLFLVTLDRVGLQCVRSVLEVMPPDEKTLRWLSEQLAKAPRISDVMLTRVRRQYENWLPTLRDRGDVVFSVLRQRFAEKSTSEARRKEALALTDDELIELIRVPFDRFRRSIIDTLGNEMSYEQRQARLESLEKEYWEHQKNNPAIVLPLLGAVSEIVKYYNIQVSHTSRCNAYAAAVEIYLHKATAGRLPETLPEGLPKDPLTGKNFEYKVTTDGFVLAHPAKYSDKGEYEFRVPE